MLERMETQGFAIEARDGHTRVFAFELLLESALGQAPRRLHMDGVMLPSGRVMLNKQGLLRHLAKQAGVEADTLATRLTQWVAEQADTVALECHTGEEAR